MSNNQNNPQEAPQVKSVEDQTKDAIIENQLDVTGWNVSPDSTMRTMIKTCMEEYSDNFQSRIAELEAINAKYMEALEKINSIDWHVDNGKYFGKSEAQLFSVAVTIANKTLNSKGVGNGDV
ncbi:hypothetical protein [Pedobacter nyackensis]|uniref:Uncharacterized protein n=1 Tax=Pedobacter nyackensis TaxID=475255 RepID=A0A1W1ZXA2_9SPHI|nr:hypothetical protein [Pedobacter nyackensis]SMC53085.1 hypothetical protein SAMN04488101_101127 [Pedobacter nyackensis]